MTKKALIAMSGGVDSSMTALLMQQAGYECVGVHMKLLDTLGADAAGARDIAQGLGMEYLEVDLSDTFREQVIEPFVAGYEAGTTPNPCIDCNRCLKFGALFDVADQLGCQYLATGHYARIAYDEACARWVPRTALDASKDQSYVLYQLSQEQLARTVLPLGDYCKTEIRALAEAAGFPNAQKSDSQDICFIPDGDYASFIEDYRGQASKPGDMLDSSGKVVGTHRGLIHYTIGQRKGLGAHGRPVFVQSIDADSNSITIGDDEDSLMARQFVATRCNWTALASAPQQSLRCQIKIGYKHRPRPGTIQAMDTTTPHMRARGDARPYKAASDSHLVTPHSMRGLALDLPRDSCVLVTFDQPVRAITPGQAAVFYDEESAESVLGGGTIN
ncbi:MAG: tRNA 2-thiouridine(34) synthase MnmA [Coriobacteriia bacterium]|nr:tRNA 2-thiouridine(34) synthase MnmA [Coriobacteriia bacterium]MCL2537715.1 tRNA 2-thiouridine(34) synthase MnmA [Coriobacteriia bacterium]